LNKGFDEHLCESLEVGEGGDVSHKIDLVVEGIFINHLQDFGEIYSEESGHVGEGESCIIIDPLDGSDNFLSQLPFYGSSVALEVAGEVQVGIICNFANGDIFIKTKDDFKVGKLTQLDFKEVHVNPCSRVGIFERAYRSKVAAKKLFNHEIKYRIPGAAALSFAYAYQVDFVIFEGELRVFDSKAGLFMCENLYKYEYNHLLLICKDLKRFEFLKNILSEDDA
jgi:myo-inositol-1(or 4)-monophosphatase